MQTFSLARILLCNFIPQDSDDVINHGCFEGNKHFLYPPRFKESLVISFVLGTVEWDEDSLNDSMFNSPQNGDSWWCYSGCMAYSCVTGFQPLFEKHYNLLHFKQFSTSFLKQKSAFRLSFSTWDYELTLKILIIQTGKQTGILFSLLFLEAINIFLSAAASCGFPGMPGHHFNYITNFSILQIWFSLFSSHFIPAG